MTDRISDIHITRDGHVASFTICKRRHASPTSRFNIAR